MPTLPTGTLTFLYTDIEGSTLRWERHPTAMRAAVERHDVIMRGAIEAAGGVVFRTMGDAFCAAFQLADNALDAVVAAQHALNTESWDADIAPIRVRMALHTGPGEVRDGDYVGAHLNRIARLLSVAHGGQTLLTQATYQLVCDTLPPGVTLRSLGEHRLRDLQRPENVYQLEAPGLPSDFPPLKTLDYHPNNLPVQPTGFVGREQEARQAVELLSQPQVRLLTFTGPGGTGKTRLSLCVGEMLLDRFEDGVFFVPLTSVSDEALVPSAIAQALDVVESSARPALETLKDYLRQKRMLLILDNFEQVVGARQAVSEPISAAPGLKVVVTSREVLHVYGEREFPVPPLRLPDPRRLPPLDALAQYESVRLFVERATSVKPSFDLTPENAQAIAEICYRLDGLPLAIELAAARVKLLTPQAILSRLESSLKVLTSGSKDLPERQQTLRGAIDWSYHLLSEDERTLFCRLAVFVGGFTLEAAEAVVNVSASDDVAPLDADILDGLASLVDKSLLRQTEGEDGEPRFNMLQTIREYALEKLQECGELAAVRRTHAEYYLELAEEWGPRLQSPQQRRVTEILEAEHDNIRAALQWSLSDEGDRQLGLRLTAAIHRVWHMSGRVAEGRRWLQMLLAGTSERTAVRARAVGAAGYLALMSGDGAASMPLLRESAEISQELGDKMGVALGNYLLGVALAFDGDPAGLEVNARAVALFREGGKAARPSLALGLLTSGMLAMLRGEYALARTICEENRALAQEVGDSYVLAQVYNYLGDIARIERDYQSAGQFYEESLTLFKEQRVRSDIPALLHNMGYVALADGDYERASGLFKESLALQQEMANGQGITECLTGFGAIAGARGDALRAARLFGASEHLREELGVYMWPVEREEWRRNVAAARQQATDEEWERAWAEGRAMSMEQAVQYAIG